MNYIRCMVWCFVGNFCTSESLRYATFTSTNIIDDTCGSPALESIAANGIFQCSSFCASNTDCGRYLFCEEDSSCKLYLDGKDCILAGDSTGCSCYKKNIGCIDGPCTCPIGYYGPTCEDIIQDCSHGANLGLNFAEPVITTMQPISSPEPFELYCMFPGGGLTIFFGRDKSCRTVDFNRSMEGYKRGFGNSLQNSWLGFNKIFHIMNNPHSEWALFVYMAREDGSKSYCSHSNFLLQPEGAYYEYAVGSFSGNCGNTFGRIMMSHPFSTYDMDHTGSNDCARIFGGGWWFDNDDNCTATFLTGTMDGSATDNFWQGGSSDSPIVVAAVSLKKVP